MELILGLALPLVILALFGLRAGRGSATHWRYYIAPAVGALGGLLGVLLADAGNTPDFWVGVCAGLAAIAGAAIFLLIQGFLPLDWWVRDGAQESSTT